MKVEMSEQRRKWGSKLRGDREFLFGKILHVFVQEIQANFFHNFGTSHEKQGLGGGSVGGCFNQPRANTDWSSKE